MPESKLVSEEYEEDFSKRSWVAQPILHLSTQPPKAASKANRPRANRLRVESKFALLGHKGGLGQ